jgi:hypothetical protein
MSEENTSQAPGRPAAIKWRTESSESRTEQVSPDGRWHLDIKTEDGRTQLYLSNFDILCSPGAFGADVRECWENFVRNCDGYAEKLAMIRDEAAAILESLEQPAQ